jgi:hypothetical protein
MASKHLIEKVRPHELTLDEEGALLGEDDVFDMVNLMKEDTGIEGVVFISTNMPKLPHGPRVKYFEKTGRDQPSFSVSVDLNPVVVASSLPERVVRRVSPQVIDWVSLNRGALLEFWNDGALWPRSKLAQFLEGGLAKLTQR